MTLLLASTVALGPLAMLIYLPVLPNVQQDFSASAELTQLTFSIFVLAMGVSQLFVGTLSDRFGRRPMILLGNFVFTLGSVFAAMAGSIEQLVIARALQAAGGGAGLVVSRAVLADLYPPEEMARRFSIIILIMLVGPSLGPIIGAEIAEVANWRAIFWILAVAGVGVFFLILNQLPETLSPEHKGPRSLIAGITLALSRRRFLAFMFLGSLNVAGYYLFLSIAPLLTNELFGTSAREFSRYFLLMAVSYALGNLVASRWGPALGIERTAFYGQIVSMSGLVSMIMAALIFAPHPLSLFLPMALIVFSQGFSTPSIQSGAVSQVPERAGAASSLISFFMQLFGAAMIQLVALAPMNSALPMIGSETVLLTLAFGLALVVLRTAPPARL